MQPVRAALDPVKAPISKAIYAFLKISLIYAILFYMHISIHVTANKPIKGQNNAKQQ